VNVVWAALVVAVATAVSIVAMLAVRRRAPEGSRFTDGDRASGVFGVLATGFSVLLGFLIFLAFESYDASRSGAESEAMTIAEQVETAQLMPEAVREELTGSLICYARWVIDDEWPRMESGTLGEAINPWAAAMFGATARVEPATASEEAAFGKWLDQTSAREEARQDRIHGASGVIPSPLWLALGLLSAIVFVFVLFFADSGEAAVVQGLLMGSVVAVIVTMLLLLRFLDDPFHDGVGGLQPVAMERALTIVQEGLAATGVDPDLPCDLSGAPA
jgi:hypothetical protein